MGDTYEGEDDNLRPERPKEVRRGTGGEGRAGRGSGVDAAVLRRAPGPRSGSCCCYPSRRPYRRAVPPCRAAPPMSRPRTGSTRTSRPTTTRTRGNRRTRCTTTTQVRVWVGLRMIHESLVCVRRAGAVCCDGGGRGGSSSRARGRSKRRKRCTMTTQACLACVSPPSVPLAPPPPRACQTRFIHCALMQVPSSMTSCSKLQSTAACSTPSGPAPTPGLGPPRSAAVPCPCRGAGLRKKLGIPAFPSILMQMPLPTTCNTM